MFQLHSRLAADTVLIGEMPLSRALLMNDSRYPWAVLTPRRSDLTEIVDLPQADRTQLMEEIAALSDALRTVRPCDKLNVGALGNLVPQLHVHVIARRRNDDAWPGPVWGHGQAVPYEAGAAAALAARLAQALGLDATR